jgi:hypothetical protein
MLLGEDSHFLVYNDEGKDHESVSKVQAMDPVSELGQHLETRFWNTPIERNPLADKEVYRTAQLI